MEDGFQVHVYSIEGTGAYGPLLLAAAQGFGEALRAPSLSLLVTFHRLGLVKLG